MKNIVKNNTTKTNSSKESKVKYWPPTWQNYLPKKADRPTITISTTPKSS